jgi:hypothetical protein
MSKRLKERWLRCLRGGRNVCQVRGGVKGNLDGVKGEEGNRGIGDTEMGRQAGMMNSE